jgi:uncharacterized repeat protein (TIGR01451 family)
MKVFAMRATARRLSGAAVATVLTAGLLVPAPAMASETPAVTLTSTSWDVIGLDANAHNWGDTITRFPVSRRVCNQTAAPVSGLKAALLMVHDDKFSIPRGWPTTNLDLGTLQPAGQPEDCREATFAVELGPGLGDTPQDAVNGNSHPTRGYTFEVTGRDGLRVVQTGTLTVEGLNAPTSSNGRGRNFVLGVSVSPPELCAAGICRIGPSDTATIVMRSASMPAGGPNSDGVQTFLDLPLDLVDVLAVKTQFPGKAAVHGTHVSDPAAIAKSDDANPIVTTYTVRGRAGATPRQADIGAVIYDNTGRSYYYNRDYASAPGLDVGSPSADLAVTVSAPEATAVGGVAEYLVTASNAGPSAASGVTLTLKLPAGSSFGGAFQGAEGDTPATSCTESQDGAVTCTIGSLAAAGSAVLRLRLTIGESAVDPVALTAIVSGAEPDPDPADNSDSDSTCLACAEPPVVTFGSGAVTKVTEHASTQHTYTFTAKHVRGIDLLVTSCGDAGERVDGTVVGEPGATERTGTVVCVFDDGGTDRTSNVTVTATNGKTNSGKATVTVSIANAAPTATLDSPVAVEPGESFTLGLSGATDASAADAAAGFTYRFDCGGGAGETWTAVASASCAAPEDAQSVTVAGWIRDKDGGITPVSRTVPVSLPATVAFDEESEAAVDEGATLRTYRFSASHPSGVSALEAGCGTAEFVSATVDDAVGMTTRYGAVKCRFDDGVYADGIATSVQVTVTATPVTGKPVTVKLPVKVANVAPNGSIDAPATVDAGSSFTLALTDPVDPSDADTQHGFSYRFDCGNGVVSAWGSVASTRCEAPDDDRSVTVHIEIADKDGDVRKLSRSVAAKLPTGAIVFTSLPRETTTGTSTDLLTVQLRGADGTPILAGAGGKLLRLHSSSPTGTFHTAGDAPTPLTTVTVPEGQDSATFRYRDTVVGTPTITVHDQADRTKDVALKDAAQQATVHPAAKALVLEGATGTLMIDGLRTFTAKIVDASGATVSTGPHATAAITFGKVAGNGAVTGLDTGKGTAGGIATVTVKGVTAGSVTLQAATTILGAKLSSGTITFPVKAGGRLAAGAVKFPATPLKTTTGPRTTTVTNIGDEPVTVTGATLTGEQAADFAIVTQGCGTLAPGASCLIMLTMTPSADGTRRTTLRVATAGGDLDVAVEGIGGSGNRAPTLRITISPERPLTTESVKADVVATDPDGDGVTLSYTWSVNGVPLQTLAKTSALSDIYDLKPQGRGDVSNLVTVVVTATDGLATATATKTVRVANSAPEARNRSSVAREGGSEVSIPLQGVDPDDQTLRYTITSLPDLGTLWVGATKVTEPGFVVRVKDGNTDLFPSVVTYVPPSEGIGVTSFDYSAADADPVQPLKSAKDGTVTVSVFKSPGAETLVTTATETAVEWTPSNSVNPVPVATKVDARRAGLGISINEVGIDATDEKTIKRDSTYRLLDVEQEVHIYTLVEGEDGEMEEGAAATATHEDPFKLTFNVLEDLLPEGFDPDEVAIYRNKLPVPPCKDGLAQLDPNKGKPLPQDEEPCWSDRDSEKGVLSIEVLTLQASQWNFAVPDGPPDTAILSGYQGVTSAGSPDDKGAPDAPEGGVIEGFSFSSNEPEATFECQLTGPGGAHQHEFEECSSGDVAYDVSGKDHPDGLYVFEVRAVKDGLEDGTPARRDFVIDRSEVSVTLDEAPAAQHPSTTAEFTFSSNKPGTVFECLIRLQSASGSDFVDCDEDFVATGLIRGAAYEFNVRGTDEAGNTGQASATFTIAPDATPPGDDDDDDVFDDDDDDDDIRNPRVGGSAPRPPGERLERVAGATRIATAADLAQRFFAPGLATVYVARSDTFPDALTGGPLAAADGAPILLVTPRRVPDETAEALRHLRPGRIVVLGGTAAVSTEVAKRLGLFASRVDRVAGPDRFGTAAQISRTLYPRGSGVALIATGLNFPDALGAGAAAAALGGPVLLVDGRLPEATAKELVRLGVKRVVVIGGARAVGQQVVARIAALTGATMERVSGPTRYDTAARLSAAAFKPGTPTAFIATGEGFADALTAAPVAAKLGSPLLIVQPRRLPEGIAAELGRVRPSDVVLLGGTNAVANEVELAIEAAIG